MKRVLSLFFCLFASALSSSSYVFVSDYNTGEVTVIDPTTNMVVNTISSSASGAYLMAATPDGTAVYQSVTFQSAYGSINVIDVQTQAVTNTINIDSIYNFTPFGVAITPSGTIAYVANNNGGVEPSEDIAIINVNSQTSTGFLGLGAEVYFTSCIAFSPDSDTAYITTADNENNQYVIIVDVNTGGILSTVATGIVFGGDIYDIQGVAFTPDGSQVWVTSGTSSITIFDAATNTISEQFTVSGATKLSGLAFTPDGTTAYVADEKNFGNVFLIDTSSLDVVNEIGVGSFSNNLAITPDGTQVYVTNRTAGTVSVISTASQSVTDTITVTSIPFGIVVTPNYAPGPPVFSISKTASLSTISFGELITYTISYSNSGGAGQNVVITDQLPTNTTFYSATQGGTYSNGTVTWNLGTVTAGGSGTVQFSVGLTGVNPTSLYLTNSSYSVSANGVSPVSGSAVSIPITICP